MTTTLPGWLSSRSARAIPAPVDAVAIRLWPQPWPSPRSASYSARKAIVGPSPLRRVAVKAVGVSATPVETSKPCSRRRLVSQPTARFSS